MYDRYSALLTVLGVFTGQGSCAADQLPHAVSAGQPEVGAQLGAHGGELARGADATTGAGDIGAAAGCHAAGGESPH